MRSDCMIQEYIYSSLYKFSSRLFENSLCHGHFVLIPLMRSLMCIQPIKCPTRSNFTPHPHHDVAFARLTPKVALQPRVCLLPVTLNIFSGAQASVPTQHRRLYGSKWQVGTRQAAEDLMWLSSTRCPLA